jgi:hypothetical protein
MIIFQGVVAHQIGTSPKQNPKKEMVVLQLIAITLGKAT